MKKYNIALIIITLILSFCGCMRQPKSVTFSDNSVLNTGRYIMTVRYLEDTAYDDKSTDLQFKSSINNAIITIGKENHEPVKVLIEEKDTWYSLTTLICLSQDKSNTEDFTLYKDSINTTYIIESEKSLNLTVRAVVGDKEPNGDETGYILSNKQICSEEFELKIKNQE